MDFDSVRKSGPGGASFFFPSGEVVTWATETVVAVDPGRGDRSAVQTPRCSRAIRTSATTTRTWRQWRKNMSTAPDTARGTPPVRTTVPAGSDGWAPSPRLPRPNGAAMSRMHEVFPQWKVFILYATLGCMSIIITDHARRE